MPSALANPREGRFAQAHLKFVAEHQANNQFLPVPAGTFTARNRRRKNVRRMRWVLFPVDVVVIHTPDHQRIGERCRNRIDAPPAPDYGCESDRRNLVENVQRDLHIVLLISTNRAPEGVKEEALRLVDSVGGEVFVLQTRRPAGHLRCYGFLRSKGCICVGQRSPPSCGFALMFFGFFNGRNAMKSA
jgi:hypothetical protein